MSKSTTMRIKVDKAPSLDELMHVIKEMGLKVREVEQKKPRVHAKSASSAKKKPASSKKPKTHLA